MGWFSRGTRRLAVATVAVVLGSTGVVATTLDAGPAAAAPAQQVSIPLPTDDPFYTPDGPIATRAPGDILKTRVVQLGFRGQGLPASATQLLYRTNDQFNNPSATVTTVISPPGVAAGAPRRVVSYHAFYDALGAQCDPSYSLRTGTASSAVVDLAMIGTMVAAGYTVVVPDYEGEKLRWTMGLESGRTALDGVRAALRNLRAPAATPVGLYGYSGGSIPTGFGAEIAPTYAPELNIVGAAAGGVLVNPAADLEYVNGSAKWAGVIPALMTVYNETYQLGLSQYLNPRGVEVLAQVKGKCIVDFADKYPGLTDTSLLKPGVGGLLDIPGMRAAAAQNVMGSAGTPRVPMMLGVGKSDSQGDGIMLSGAVAGLAADYCKRGVPTEFRLYPGQSHVDAILPWSNDALRFLSGQFNGAPEPRC